jgi:hypothetical protein
VYLRLGIRRRETLTQRHALLLLIAEIPSISIERVIVTVIIVMLKTEVLDFPHKVYLSVPHDCQNKQPLYPYKAFRIVLTFDLIKQTQLENVAN